MIAERGIEASGLAWAIVRPPVIEHRAGRGPYRVGGESDVDLMHGARTCAGRGAKGWRE